VNPRLIEWLIQKWTRKKDDDTKQAYLAAFSSFHGRVVLDHLLTNIYMTIYEGTDPVAGAIHEGRRSVVHEILEIIDQGEQPEKYKVKVERTDLLEGFHG